ncbi:MAG: NAD(P)H-dependent oxidoreductase subunit E [Burkholderiaceae bacterium]
MSHALNEDDARTLASLIEDHRAMPGGLLPLLHRLQDQLGYVPDGALSSLAQAFGLSRAEVHGVVSFYHFFRTSPPARHLVQVCQAEACQACDATALMTHAHALRDAGPAGEVDVEAVYCLGLCASSPAIMIDGQPHGRVTPQALSRLMQALEKVT